MNHKVFQYVPMSMSNALTRIVPKIINIGAVPVLDIEDSVQDTLNPQNTPGLKKNAREAVPALIARCFDLADASRGVYLRINSQSSDEYSEDIGLLRGLLKAGYRIGVFLPKINSADDLASFRDALEVDCSHLKVVPIIETVSSLNNINEILSDRSGLDLDYIHYGHFDYSLDAKCWPFYEQTSQEFWAIVDDLICAVQNAGMRYMHTPFGQLYNYDLFQSVIRTVSSKCNREFAITALNYDQSTSGVRIGDGPSVEILPNTLQNKISIARKVVEEFEGNLRAKRSFAMNQGNGEFITPHHYKMAKAYIAQNSYEKY
jgi:citrate lyase beta subunit